MCDARRSVLLLSAGIIAGLTGPIPVRMGAWSVAAAAEAGLVPFKAS